MSDRRFPSQECLNFIDNIRFLCDNDSLPYYKISEACGFYPQYITQFLNYRGTSVPLDTAVRFSRYFGIPIEFLIAPNLGKGKKLVITDDYL